VNIYLWR